MNRRTALATIATALASMAISPMAMAAGNGAQKQDGSGGNCDMTCLPIFPSPGTIIDKSLLIKERLQQVQPGMTAREMIDFIGILPNEIVFNVGSDASEDQAIYKFIWPQDYVYYFTIKLENQVIESIETVPAEVTEVVVDYHEATLGEKNALRSAENYLDFTYFSYDGLIDQLKFEGYSLAEATYAADRCGADWNEQAVGKAEQYLDFMPFSRDGLIGQLEFEGFTTEQAEYAASVVGY